MDDELYYDPEYKVLICRKHKLAVKGLDWHLKDAHGLRSKKERQPILDQYDSLVLLLLNDVLQPPNNCAPFEALGTPLDGFQCIECGHISVNYKSMRGHCNKTHEWYVTKDEPTHWTQVKVQTFFGIGTRKYFTVRSLGPELVPIATVDLSHEEVVAAEQLQREFKELTKRHRERLDIMEMETEKSDKTGWWNFVKWQDHFSGRNMRRVAHAGRLPDRSDQEMKHVTSIVKTMIQGAVNGLDTMYDDTPHWLRTANSTERVENRPMVRLQNPESLDTYIIYFQ
jgi:hypothetical protein